LLLRKDENEQKGLEMGQIKKLFHVGALI